MKKQYEIIIEYIEKLILDNKLKQGDRLPSIRVLAEEFTCNKSTVIRAYQELELEHKIYSIPKGGFYLVEKLPPNSNKFDKIDFSEVLPDPNLLPYREFTHCINRAVELYKDTLFSYGDTQGLASLRRVLAEHFREQQIFTSLDNIFITSGAQQALSILARMPFPNNKLNILVEQPTYGLLQELAKINGKNLIGIDRNNGTLDLKKLEMLFKDGNIKFFYTIPRMHNPLGISYSEGLKKELVKLSEKYDVYIVEDDYLGDLDTDSRVLPIHYYDTSQRVIYIKSFSKAFMPGIRIGAVVLNESLRKEFLRYKRCDDLNTSVLSQGALEIYINSGMFKNHNRKIKLEYRRKMDFFREYVNSFNKLGAELVIPETGFFVWVKLPCGVKIDTFEKRLRERKVLISSANNFYISSDYGDNAFRLCISRLSKDEIKIGMEIIFEEIGKSKTKL